MSTAAAPDTTAEARLGPGGFRIDFTLAVVLAGFRLVGAAWLTVLAILTLTSDEDVHGWVIGAAIAAVWVWTAVTALVLRRQPELLLDARFLVADMAVALWILAAPLLDGAPAALNFSGGYPASSVLLWAYVWRIPGGVAAAGLAIAIIVVSDEYSTNGRITIGLVYAVLGLMLPWGITVLRRNERLRLAAEAALATERAERIRSQERAEMAARVHDSVLQTLALIQRRAEEPDEVRSLARRQERQLRESLFGPADLAAASFSGAVRDTAADVEGRYQVTVDTVTVGDCEMDEPLEALLQAGREALTNAAKFSGVGEIAVYSEVGFGRVALFVRDRGAGFDPDAVNRDRRGIADSIVARMERHGGNARVTSALGAGTEVELTMPRRGEAS